MKRAGGDWLRFTPVPPPVSAAESREGQIPKAAWTERAAVALTCKNSKTQAQGRWSAEGKVIMTRKRVGGGGICIARKTWHDVSGVRAY